MRGITGKIAAIGLFAVAIAPGICGQQIIGQIVREYKGKARDEITVHNTGLRPVLVTLEALSFTVSETDHKVHLIPLAPGVLVKIGSSGAQLAPNQSYFFPFEATCTMPPCAIQLRAKFQNARAPKSSIAVSVNLSTAVYVCQDRAKGCRDEILHSWGVK
jgi:hypothetical protein